MNELLQKHGCSNVFHVPEGLKELMSDISREPKDVHYWTKASANNTHNNFHNSWSLAALVHRNIITVLRIQPKRLNDFIANYLSALLITREHGIMATKILEDLCDCQPSVSEHLLNLGLDQGVADTISKIIKEEIEDSPEPVEGKEKLREYLIVKKILTKVTLDEQTSAEVCQIARCAYKDYWYRRNLLKQSIKMTDEEPWEIAARNTLNLYKKTKPSLTELNRATQRIQAAYRGYHVRRHVLRHLLPKKDKRQGRKVDLGGPPLDIDGSRDVNLGPVINIRTAVKEDNVTEMFEKEAAGKLGIPYDPMKTLPAPDELSPREAEGRKPEAKQGLTFAKGAEGQFSDETPFIEGKSIVHTDRQLTGPGRISFSEIPPEVIRDVADEAEVPDEAVADTSATTDTPDITEDLQGGTEGTGAEGIDSEGATDVEGVSDVETGFGTEASAGSDKAEEEGE